jgi:hypothetical protein
MTEPRSNPRRSAMDRVFYRLVTLGWREDRVSDYVQHAKRYQSSLPSDMTEAFGLIDVKATGTLTHVSLMIAGLGLIAPLVAESMLEVGVVIAEIGIYLLIAIGCLRCLAVFRTRDLSTGDDDLIAIAQRELIIRLELYNICNRGATLFTIVVFLLLPALFFYRPEHMP